MAAEHAMPDRWLRRPLPRPEAALQLVCVPHAGGAAGFFRAWAPLLPASIELAAVQLPGREDRYGDPASTDLDAVADALTGALLSLNRETVLFGHSMGALVAYEVARRLAQAGRPAQRLFVSGRRAPTEVEGGVVHRQDDATLHGELDRLGGTPAEVMADPELRRAILDCLREDYRLVETHRSTGAATDCPITVLTGEGDPETPADAAPAWHRLAGGPDRVSACDAQRFPGDHFYLVPRRAEVIEAILERVSAPARTSAGAGPSFP